MAYNGSSDVTNTDRRKFLLALGAVSVTGVAGCGGDGDGDTPTETESEDGDSGGDTPTGTETETETETVTPTATPDPEPLGEEPATLITLSGGGSVNTPESSFTLNGTLMNPYIFDVESVEVSVGAPDGWSVDPSDPHSFESISDGGSEEVSWEITIPPDASGQSTLTVNVSYESATDSADVTIDQSINVIEPGEVPVDGLLAHFPLDGTPPANAVGDGEGTINGDPTTDAEGVIGGAYDFDGEDDYVDLPGFVPDGSNATVSVWVNADSWGGPDEDRNEIVFWGDGPPQFEIVPQGGTLRFHYWDGSQRNGFDTTDATVPTGEWVHICGVYDIDDGTAAVYMNGEEVASTAVSAEVSFSGTNSRLASHPNESRAFDGRIDQVRFYQRALSQSEVAQLATEDS